MPITICNMIGISKLFLSLTQFTRFIVSHAQRTPSPSGLFLDIITELHDSIVFEYLILFGKHMRYSGVIFVQHNIAHTSRRVIRIGWVELNRLVGSFIVHVFETRQIVFNDVIARVQITVFFLVKSDTKNNRLVFIQLYNRRCIGSVLKYWGNLITAI